jgi:hypothetical protein
VRFEFKSGIFYLFYLYLLYHVENRDCLSHGVQVASAAWQTVMRIVTVLGDLVQRIRDGRTGRVLSGRTIKRSDDAVCGLHCARRDKEHEFLDWASKPRSTVCEWFGLKTTMTVCQWFDLKIIGTVFSGLTSKSVTTVSLVWPQNRWRRFISWASKSRWRVFWFGPQNRQLRCSDLCLKITVTVSWFEPQNQANFGLSIAP